MARIGLSDGSNASSVIENSVTRTGTTRLVLQTNSTSGASGGRISSVPLRCSAATRQQLATLGIDQRFEQRELRRDAERTALAFWSGSSSWSVASISASSLIDSIAGPFRRNGCARSPPPSPPTPCTW